MTYQALARKWRPRTFEQVVGQQHVVQALSNALEQQRIHHAMLFSGTRGVGKTTLGRIISKCLNCETGVTATPCGTCSACEQIDQGRFVDLIEIDAASRTKVDDTRELLDNVQYAPTRGRYKVYLIDEVHMLSKHSFNALLKTLEEPPPHVRFLLATTDPQKLPITILSRCLQFNLKRLPPLLIRERLASILAEEGVEAETDALQALAIAADGSMRDSLSLTDQAIAFAGGALTLQSVEDMLGSVGAQDVLAVIEVVNGQDPDAMAALLHKLDEQAPDFDGLLAQIASALQQIALAQLVPAYRNEASVFDADKLQAMADAVSPEDVQLFYQIAMQGRRDLPVAPDPRAGFEMTLLRMMAFRPVAAGGTTGTGAGGQARSRERQSEPAEPEPASPVIPRSEAPADPPKPTLKPGPAQAARGSAVADRLQRSRARLQGAAQAPQPVPDRAPAPPSHVDNVAESPAPAPAPVHAAPATEPPAPDTGKPRVLLSAADWPALVRDLAVDGMAAQLARRSECAEVTDARIRLRLPAELGRFNRPATVERLRDVLRQQLANPGLVLDIDIVEAVGPTLSSIESDEAAARQADAEAALANDDNVSEFERRFGATILEGSIQPVDPTAVTQSDPTIH
ncbi:MAG: DNA polymerase III subunit gamma/tau [Abyssibacter sp.]|uniref:DNA polymerase III subunit gamma/tau n=1 Tax=Abyssibacter sp. TaxID=2320200 RepID=UPI00321BF748